MAILRLILALLGGLAMVVAAAGFAQYQAVLDSPLDLPADGATLEVPSGQAFATLARELETRGWLRDAAYLRLHGRLSGLATRIQAGEYALAPTTTPRQLLAMLATGQVRLHALTVVEGWTFAQLRAAVAAHPKLRPTLAGLDASAIMARLGRPGEHPEGRFFPDTYYFPANTTDLAFLRRAYATMEERLAATWAQRSPDLPLETPYQALILASIIEKETGQAGERAEIAGVFVRRLRKGMRLQTDPTVIYGLGDAFDGNLTRAHLRQDTPYNTYTRHGLTPTPIALPGAAALAAAVNPAPGDTYYFVARGDGSHAFSRTLQEHNRAVRRYQLGQ
ncbi:MAG: endolytic transglycosylase MltG [Candidatus Competibacterales bacterium]